jgi:hypothetical protein
VEATLLLGPIQASQEGDSAQRDYAVDTGSLLDIGKLANLDRGIPEREID